MPKPRTRHNPSAPATVSQSSGQTKKPIGIKDLLGRAAPLQRAIARQTDRGVFWREFFALRLPAELAGQVTQVVERDGALCVYAASAAWSARLRFAVAELWPAAQQAEPGLKRWSVRVQPAAASAGARA